METVELRAESNLSELSGIPVFMLTVTSVREELRFIFFKLLLYDDTSDIGAIMTPMLKHKDVSIWQL